MNRYKVLIIVLTILLIISSSYIALEKLSAMKQEIYNIGFQDGYNRALEDAILTLYQQTENCQRTTIRVGNLTREIIDVKCIE